VWQPVPFISFGSLPEKVEEKPGVGGPANTGSTENDIKMTMNIYSSDCICYILNSNLHEKAVSKQKLTFLDHDLSNEILALFPP